MPERKNPLLSLAGFDPSGGAGALLDVRVFERLGFRGWAALTAVTIQNPRRVSGVVPLPARTLAAQYRALLEAGRPAGIKVGMLATSANLEAAARILGQNGRIPRVVDPVFQSSSGASLLDGLGISRFLAVLGGKATLVTPNLEEASILSKREIRTLEDMKAAARAIHDSGRMACLVTGGHLKGGPADVLFDGAGYAVFEHPRIGKNVHGTGCFLSSAVLGYLAGGRDLKTACRLAIGLTARAIGMAVPDGRGRFIFDLEKLPAPRRR
jgi:hydroxymethylpyrimidine kinase/phosphomethylpyrimidine kinase